MAFYVYEYTLYKDYEYLNGTHFDEYWKQVGVSNDYDLAEGIATGKADQYSHNHRGRVGEFVKENEIIGIKNKHETIGGITVDVDPLPYMEIGFYIITEDFGDQRKCFTDENV
jgi:hypothetical protein